MPQTRLESLIETCLSTVVGYVVALCSQLVIFPQFGVHLPLADNMIIGLWFTAVSVLRGYAVRRWFNARLKRAAAALAGHRG